MKKNWRHLHPNSTTGNECALVDASDEYLGEWMSIGCQTLQNGLVCAKSSRKLADNQKRKYLK